MKYFSRNKNILIVQCPDIYFIPGEEAVSRIQERSYIVPYISNTSLL